MAESPSGSRHRCFKWPDAVAITNSTSSIGPGIDVRGEGGMVIAPPSVRDDGAYRWLNDNPIADAPQWLIDLAVGKGADDAELGLARKNASGNSGEAPDRFKVAEDFKDLPVEDLGGGPHDPHAEPGLIAAALAVIPRNDDDPHSGNYWTEIEQTPGRDYMVKIGMAVKAASNDSTEGLALFDKWRSGAPDYYPDVVKKKWEGFHPTQIGFGTLSFYAEKASPGW